MVIACADGRQRSRRWSSRLDAPEVFFEASGLENANFDCYDPRVSGLIGNRLFFDRYTVIVDLAHERLGLIAGRAE